MTGQARPGYPLPPRPVVEEDSEGLACRGGTIDDDRPAAQGLLADFSAGSRIAGYRLEERISQGGMAVVFRARDERLQRQVALKILSPSLATDEAFRHRFIRESRSAAAVDNPHIIPVLKRAMPTGCCSSPCGMCPAVMWERSCTDWAAAHGAGGGDYLRGGLGPGCRPCRRTGAP